MAPKRNLGAIIVVILVLGATAALVWYGLRDARPATPKQERLTAKPPIDADKPPDEPAGPAVRGVIKGVDAKPRGDARVLLASTYERLSAAVLRDPAAGYRTHADGRFAVPLPRADWVLVALSDEGYAQVTDGEYREGMDVVLRPWAKVQGVATEGRAPVEGAEIVTAMGRRGVPNHAYYLEFEQRARTDAAGRYSFDKVPPGTNFVAWVERGRVSIHRRGLGMELEPGQSKTVDFGGAGRPVTAKLVAAGLAEPLLFRGALWPLDIDVAGDWEAMEHAQREKIARAWLTSPAGRQATNLAYPLAFEADPDGNVRVADVPPGFYRVVITGATVETRGGASEVVSNVERFIHVPARPEDEPFPLGTIEMPVKMRVSPGTPAPELVATTADGKELKLSSFKGRHVLLVLWVAAKRKHEVRTFHAIRDLYGDDPRLALVELTTTEKMPPQLGGWTRGTVDLKAVAPEYLGADAPAFLIGPDGAFAAWDLPGRRAYGAVDEALRPLPAAAGTAKVNHDHANGDGAPFVFKAVPPPAKDDLGTSVTWTIVAGDKDRGPISALHDGEVPDRADDPTRNLSFTVNTLEGRIRCDLGRVAAVKQVNSYSWHPGNRAAQVYRLYGSTGDGPGFNPDPAIGIDPAKAGWTLIANVDTRGPDGAVGGQVGVAIASPVGAPFKYRYLLFVPFSTGIRDGWEMPFFSEIDVIGE